MRISPELAVVARRISGLYSPVVAQQLTRNMTDNLRRRPLESGKTGGFAIALAVVPRGQFLEVARLNTISYA
jgi:hypothetical protein